MGSVFGSGGGGGSSGDQTTSKSKQLPSPEAIAAMRAAANSASGVAGVAKNLPYNAMVASSPGYRQALQNTANTWNGWMGTAPLDLSQGMPAISQNSQFGSVIDAGQAMNNQISQLPPDIQYMLSQWAGPGPITPGSPYDPIKYDPYINQLSLLHGGTAQGGGVGQVGAGGIPTTTLPPTVPPPGSGAGGGGTPPPTTRPPPPGWPPGKPWPPVSQQQGNQIPQWILNFRQRMAANQGSTGGANPGSFQGGWASGPVNSNWGQGSDFNHGLY